MRAASALAVWSKALACRLQLTTDKGRADAHRFYESLGFTGSHLGYKMTL